MEYKKEDTIKISWKEFDNFALKIKSEVQAYLDKKKIKLDLVVPIFRGGGILGLKLAFMFNVLRIFPYQYKYFSGKEDFELKKIYDSNFNSLINFNKKDPIILVVEGSHSEGIIAKKVIEEIKEKLPLSKIIYVALAKDYFYKDSVKEVEFTTCGFFTNENKKISKEECERNKIKFDKAFIFPWENLEEELASLNNTTFKYNNQEDF